MKFEVVEVLSKILDSNDTTVGGGSASALTGAMAASMIGMVAKLSKKKPVNFTEQQYDAIAAECELLSEQLQQGSIDDTLAYCGIVNAFKLPNATEDNKQIRRAAIQAAAIHAAEVPLDNARLSARVYELGNTLLANSNPGCVSDLQSALYLSRSGVKDCVLNIQANLMLIKNQPTQSSLKEDMLSLLLKVI